MCFPLSLPRGQMEGADPEDSNLNGPLQRGFNTRNAAKYLDFSEGYLRKARRGLTEVAGPQYHRVGSRCIYTKEQLDSWLARFKVEG